MAQMNCEFKKKKGSYNEWTMKFSGMTEGMILALARGMQLYSEQSAVGNDVYQFIKYAYLGNPDATPECKKAFQQSQEKVQ